MSVKTLKKVFIVTVISCLPALAGADRSADEAAIRKALGEVKPTSIQPAPLQGLYEVLVGPNVLYMSADGRYMIQGELVDVVKRENLTEPRRREAQRDTMQSIKEDQMIVFAPEKVKHTVTVFTDIDCGYCRKLHTELSEYLDAGIKIRYMMYPRAGAGSDSYRKAVAVWCAKDRNGALTDAKAGKSIDMKTCDNPVDAHMELARMMGLRGTPFLVLEDGRVQPGYVPAKQLSHFLEQTQGR